MPKQSELARQLIATGREFHARGWLAATSGNLSAVLSRRPLRLLVTASGTDKGRLRSTDFVRIDEASLLPALRAAPGSGKSSGAAHRASAGTQAAPAARASSGAPEARRRVAGRRPSDEALLHLLLAREYGAEAVLHTHSISSTVLSEGLAPEGGVALQGFEMLKALEGVRSHEHREWIPIVENAQDMPDLARRVSDALSDRPGAHGFLIRGHGLYSWGASLAAARRQIEALEFLFEVLVRGCSFPSGQS